MFVNIRTLTSSRLSLLFTVLGFVFLLFLYSGTATAQTRDKFVDEYLNLKNKPAGLKGREEAKPDLIVLIESQKIEAGVAKVRFIIDGKLARQDIQIQPLLIPGKVDEEVSRITNAGDPITIKARLPNSREVTETISNPEIILPVDINANVLRITIGLQSGELADEHFIVPLNDKPEIFGVRIFMPKRDVSSVTDSCDCPFVEFTNARCGTISKYCGGYVGNVLDGTNCSITCGSPCTNKNCTVPVEGDSLGKEI